ncbi:hypothetical protein VHEMI09564 [[Torrubiella] hemipterigena]|uniref:Yeast cell wall synthesis Kre9/Knh1-like N-terminal domain-containing protein n=1 Tax=[Torrubiella] hemipterigena TaxID=1531966 RepID=A0A0A1TRQ2_9HYPO|nr:hypothetical protein VHEMI09564 [[Torrubiella] hemipterigena]
MKFSLATVLAFAATVAMGAEILDDKFDSVSSPPKGTTVKGGDIVVISWTFSDPKYAKGNVKIDVLGGADQGSLQKVGTVAASVANNDKKLIWNVPADLGADAVYGLKFTSLEFDDIIQFSQPFHITASAIISQSGSSASTLSATGSSSATKSDSSMVSAVPSATTTHSKSHNATTSAPTGMTTQPSGTSTDKTTSASKSAPASTSSSAAAAMVGSTVAAVGGIVAALLAL